MAMKTRIGGYAAIQYEDFQPKPEWKEEEGENVLRIHLPGELYHLFLGFITCAERLFVV
jgi:hypothetical protein